MQEYNAQVWHRLLNVFQPNEREKSIFQEHLWRDETIAEETEHAQSERTCLKIEFSVDKRGIGHSEFTNGG